MILERKLAETETYYASEAARFVSDLELSESTNDRRESASALRATVWFEARCGLLRELAETERVPEDLLVSFANRLPGPKVRARRKKAPKPSVSAQVITFPTPFLGTPAVKPSAPSLWAKFQSFALGAVLIFALVKLFFIF